jgi:hypothetical protein
MLCNVQTYLDGPGASPRDTMSKCSSLNEELGRSPSKSFRFTDIIIKRQGLRGPRVTHASQSMLDTKHASSMLCR